MFLLLDFTHRMVFRYHPEIGHLYVPLQTARIPNEVGGYYIETNRQGFRSDLDFVPERGARPRILFFGDSYTAGDGCSNGERFPELVGEALGAEVYNYGLAGSGTDQQLLVAERLAAGVEADLVVLGVFVENIERIQTDRRSSVDRNTGRSVWVHKPWFELEDGDLRLHGVPVPMDRPPVGDDEVARSVRSPGWLARLRGLSGDWPRLRAALDHPRLRELAVRATGYQPYDEYRSSDTPAWKLMAALVRRFARSVAPRPLLVVPIPTHSYYREGATPGYQPLFESLADPARGLHVLDLTRHLVRLSRRDRERLEFRRGLHFTPFGHREVAACIAGAIAARDLLPGAAAGGSGRTVAIPRGPERARAGRPRPAAGGGDPRRSPRAGRYVLGISCLYHDSAACLVRDGEIVAASEEERFTRVKNDRRFPHYAANACLESGGIQQDDLAAVVYYESAPLTLERIFHTLAATAATGGGEAEFQRVMPSWLRHKAFVARLVRDSLCYDGPIHQSVHHRSHAASAFLPSPFERAAILTIDGVGEWATASIGVGRGSEVELLREMRFPHSVGLLYSAFTQFTGFAVNSGEYKMMGLAPYGEDRYSALIRDELVDVKSDGSIELDLSAFEFLHSPVMTGERFARLFGGPARDPEAPIGRRELDLARSVQVVLEEIVMRMARHAASLTGERKLCLAGGVALNCVANGELARHGPFEEIWIQPAAGDAGAALGAALDFSHARLGVERRPPVEGGCAQGHSCFGPAYGEGELRAFLETHGYPFRELSPDERAGEAARILAEGKALGHFEGGGEFGPRALGARSILADPRSSETQTSLNLKIKHRESFRPFAPAVLEERTRDYFDLEGESPYMLIVSPVVESRRLPFDRAFRGDLLAVVRQPRSDVPAVTHVDYSARVQTVSARRSPAFRAILEAFEARTGCPILVNTSFNVRGEPIVCTPYDAYRCFMRTEMDALLLGPFLLAKAGQPPWPEVGAVVEEEQRVVEEVPAAFRQGLARIFQREFAPAAAALAREGALGVGAAERRFTTPSTWREASGARATPRLFDVPPALDRERASPAAEAQALAADWSPGPARERFEPVLASLLALARRFPERGTWSERVSDLVYVMD